MSATSINNVIGKRFIELLSVDSTNNYAMQQAKKGRGKSGDVYFAFDQSAGKGQLNKQWLSEKGANIIMSAVLETNELLINQQFILNMIAALSAVQLFNNYTNEKIKVKWPNDIYFNDRKAAGILIENMIRGKKWQFAVIGFGININQTLFSDALKNPVSLKQITGKHYDVIALAKELCSLLTKNLEQLFSGNENLILTNYNEQLYKRNEIVKFKQSSVVFSGMVKGVNNFGKLIVENDAEYIFETGSIEWIH